MLDKPVTTCMGNCCSPSIRSDVYDGVLFVLSVCPRDVLDEILLIESVSEGIPTYSTSFLWLMSDREKRK